MESSNHLDLKIHQNICYSLPDGQTRQLLQLLNNYVSGQKDIKIKFYIKQHIKLLSSYVQEVEHTNNLTLSHFPCEINMLTGEVKYTHEFSWTRGDLPILVLLYKADIAFNENNNSFIADTVGSIVAKRTKIEVINQNPFIRYGTAGIAQCFYTLYNLSKKKFYEDAYNFWIKETYRLKALVYPEVQENNFIDNIDGTNKVLATTLNENTEDWYKQILL
jgi:hypothetical protein